MKLSQRIIIIISLIITATFSQAAETVKIASIFAKTGKAAAGNLSAITGVRFAVRQLNQQGGLLGKTVEIIEYDNHSTSLHSKKAAQKAAEAGVAAVFGANWSSHSMAMAPVLQAARIPMLAIYSTNPAVTRAGDFIFRVCFIDSFQGRIMSNFAFRDLKARTAAVLINASQKYSEGLADFFIRDFQAKGGKILFKADYLHDATDYSPPLEAIVTLKPDVVFVPGNIVDSALIIKQARDMGLEIPFLGGDGWGTSMYDHAGAALHGAYFTVHWHEENQAPQSRHFVTEYYRNFKKPPVDSGTALAFDAVFLFADAVKRAGSIEPEKVRPALAATRDFNGITGKIAFNEGRDPVKSAIILKFDDGKTRYVKTVQP
ncbi:MAG: ABC transporter substrate-binding protein [Desulfobacter sp.]|nr:MAG: ABC transporter substrate-binding protein [Desulfobacter sp.]